MRKYAGNISIATAILSALTLTGCGSQRNVTRQTDTKTEAHYLDEVMREVSVDTSKSEETTVTVTEWFYEPSAVDTAVSEDATAGGTGAPQLKYKRQTTYTRKRTENGVSTSGERHTVQKDTATSENVNENIDEEKGTNTVKGLRNTAWIIGLSALLVLCLAVLVVVVKRFLRPKIL